MFQRRVSHTPKGSRRRVFPMVLTLEKIGGRASEESLPLRFGPVPVLGFPWSCSSREGLVDPATPWRRGFSRLAIAFVPA